MTPLEPKDAAALIIVGRVFDRMAETGDWSMTRAFRATGVDYWSFYRAFKRPIVQGIVAERLLGQQAATAAILDEYWLRVLNNMAEIASGGKADDRAAIQAARFLLEVHRQLEMQLGAHKTEEKSLAATLLAKAKARSQITRTRRTVVTEEVDVKTG